MNTWNAVIGFLLGGSFLTFLQFLINRHDNKQDKNDAVLSAIKDLDGRVEKIENSLDERDAVLARTHILRFKDEIYNNGADAHSLEYYEQTLDDIQTYDLFCSDHPKFANGRTKAAAKYIREVYDKLTEEHKL